ncbi:MAG: 3-deoxy-7-phosphoheptulonate synthase [Phycisphaeraceae bacterium]
MQQAGNHALDHSASDLEPTQNLNVAGTIPLTGPRELEQQFPATAASNRTVIEGRRAIQNILRGDDPRLLVVLGPCSIHDVNAAMDYARRLATLRERYADRLFIVMRVYFEKPRTTVGWKGLINDPHLDGSFDLAEGLRLARKLLLEVTGLGLPVGTEMLDPITPQYIDDLVSWASIGARTTESQTHRQMASGLSMPVGYKNATNGSLQVALDAMKSARSAHHFLGIDEDGRSCIVATRGNPFGHLILRGGTGKPNYHPDNVADAAKRLRDADLEPRLMIDCSHANSNKKHEQQEAVWQSILDQRAATADCPIIGAMLESNLHEGKQAIPEDKGKLAYGVSVTDACIGWEKTEQLLDLAYTRSAP